MKRGVEVAEEQKVANEQEEATETKTQEIQEKDPMQEANEKIAQLEAKYAEMEDKYLRSQAEMANMHTRFKKEQEQLLKYEGQALAKAILPVIDNLNRALSIEVSDEGSQQLKRGIEMVANDMNNALTNNNVTKIEALGQPFDPTLHQAVKTVEASEDSQKETVVEVFQDGYLLKDRVLRPAMVVVAQ
ncbi:nucleotide exchange factor GrpE [Ligilactobacillus sp. Marseille-Q7487]|uniref:nucleotide exchange factor GrpE n=1 Tax=Ligilactobacillus sp. Marseille-Q7487 TaxID=3022128 RepID=UPI0024A7DBA5|nr:nucleotide exchange factor GrpE [Ligilactobacillus sp. Marseille-Q7487]